MITTVPTMRNNVDGKQYDTATPFRLTIAVTKGDKKGEILDAMKRGMCCAYKDSASAEKEMNKFLGLAKAVQGDFASYGVITIINEEQGCIVWANHIS